MSDHIQKFEDLLVWKEAMNLAVDLNNEMARCRNYGLRDQITRAAISIPSNIAEGFERKSNKEFIHFLYITKGSCGELRTQLYIAFKTDNLSKKNFSDYLDKTHKISAMLYKLIQARFENF